MADAIDQAQEREQLFRTESILTARSHPAEPAEDDGCISCGNEISAERRRVLPTARRCLPCQEAAERRGHLGRGA